MSEERFSETKRNCYYTSLVLDNKTQEELGTDKVVVLLNEYLNENEKLKKVIDLMEYQLKVQDRIIKEYEDGESNEL